MTSTQTKPIGATVMIRWKDETNPDICFQEYVSFGEYNEDNETDTFGISDLLIMAYVDSLEELQRMEGIPDNSSFDWLLTEIVEVHHA